MQTVYLRRARPPAHDPAVCALRPLTPDMAEWVNAHYRQDEGELDYVRWLLARGVFTGAYLGDVCAGFIGRHSDGSIGLLEVLPAYRRRGIGEALLCDALTRELEAGHVPFGQIVVGNAASIALNRKCGMTVSEGRIWWLEAPLAGG